MGAGFASSFGAKRVWVHTGGRTFENTNLLFNDVGIWNSSYLEKGWNPGSISVTVEGSATDPMYVYAESLQSVVAYSAPAPFGMVVISNLSILVDSIVISAIT